jgi:hypothetical protein
MTIDEFDDIIDCLIRIMLPPNVSDDRPASAEEILAVLDAHAHGLRSQIGLQHSEIESERP